MSLLSPDIRVALTPGLVAVAAPRLYREAQVAEGSDALAALDELLRSLQLRARARVVLSHELARVRLLPAPSVRLNAAEMKGWVRDHLAQQFGDDTADGWRITWQPAPPWQPVLTGAVEAGWFAAMQQILSRHGLKLAAAEPWLATACARLRSTLDKGSAWLALAEPGRITLASLEQGVFRALRSSRVSGDPAAALAGMLARESLRADLADNTPVWLESVQVQADWRGGSGLEVRQAASGQTGLASMMEG